jgi:2-polyprenyl-3-methyl-5-hydroxy-6-metoxy-1,4-benzoquinol methylase
MDKRLQQEASSFDRQIEERVAHGHIPDLRRCGRCEYFYNNVWRDSVFANLFFGDLVSRIQAAIQQYRHESPSVRILEVGCGPGHISLELARLGYHVTGLDLSSKCIEVAAQTADTDPWKDSRGALSYVAGDIYSHTGKYDVVVFIASLHHFRETQHVLEHIGSLLSPGGLIFVHEPTRDRVNDKNVVVIGLIRILLSCVGAYYDPTPLPTTEDDLQNLMTSIMNCERYENEDGDKIQSINDNEAGFQDMIVPLQKKFETLDITEGPAFYTQLIGGGRFDEPEKERRLALALKLLDNKLCEVGAVDSTNFTYIGRKRS